MLNGIERCDVGGTLRPARRMPDGRLRVDAYITRTGVFKYQNKDGSTRLELRHPDDVFDPESLASFEALPVTNTHPKKLLTSKTARDHMVGASGERVERDGDHVKTSLMIADESTIAEMDAGEKVEVSNGYSLDLEEGPGYDPVFGRWDFRQRNIRGNHIALVSKGRAGSTARVRLDASETASDGRTPRFDSCDLRADIPRVRSNVPMADNDTIRALGAELKDAEAKLAAAEKASKDAAQRADSAEGQLEVAEKKIGEMAAQIEANSASVESAAVKREKDRADALAERVTNFDADFAGAVRARATLQNQAAMVMGPKFRMDDMTDRHIRAEVIKRLDASVDTSAKVTDGKVEGIFEALVKDHVKGARNLAEIAEHLDAVESAPKTKKQTAEDVVETRRDAWRKPLPNSREARKGN